MGKKKQYRFWRWLILSIVRIPKLYVLVWGILVVLALLGFKNDIWSLVRLLS
ncbi:MAG: hypothetical protein J6039_04645 [Alphaproteobacteria bacterium]|nr:hypothetical protein [Alphaproteobacteria bacterium]